MSTVLNQRVQQLKPSLLWKFFDLANETPDVISLSVGEPDFPTPWHVREEGIYAIEKGRTYYPPTRGLLQLRRGIAAYYRRRFGIGGYTPEQILVSVGGSEALDLALRVTLTEGDEVIVPDPGYVAYEPLVRMAGGVPVYLPLKEAEGFKVTRKNLQPLITAKTKMIILNYPSNPTGGIMTYADYAEIVPLLRQHHIVALCDEIYLELTYDAPACSLAQFRKELGEQLIIINGFSKAWSMTGWRLGFALAQEPVITAMNAIHQYSAMGPATPAQFAAIEAISARSDRDIEEHVLAFKGRRHYLVNRMNQMGLRTAMPEGAFYVFANITSTGLDSFTFATRLLKEAHVCCIPGNAFGPAGEGFVRISYAYSLERLREACMHIEAFMKQFTDQK